MAHKYLVNLLKVCAYVSSPVETYRRPVPQQKLLPPGKSAEDLEGMDCSTITRVRMMLFRSQVKKDSYVTLDLIMCEGGMDGQKEKESISMGSLKGGCVVVTLDKALFVSVARKCMGEYYCLNHEFIRIY